MELMNKIFSAGLAVLFFKQSVCRRHNCSGKLGVTFETTRLLIFFVHGKIVALPDAYCKPGECSGRAPAGAALHTQSTGCSPVPPCKRATAG